jgi:hypothetical protein
MGTILHQPQLQEHQDESALEPGRDRVPFIYTRGHPDGHTHVYMGYPGSEHGGITAPGGRYWSYQSQDYENEIPPHPGLNERVSPTVIREPGKPTRYEWGESIAGYGSVKPRSWYTGKPEHHDDRSLEFYTVHEPEVLGDVADEVSKHYGLGPHGFKNEPRIEHDPNDEWEFNEPDGGYFG